MAKPDLEHFTARLNAEQAAAEGASCPEARAAHLAMVEVYSARLAEAQRAANLPPLHVMPRPAAPRS